MKRFFLLALMSVLFLAYASAQERRVEDESVVFTEAEKERANTAKRFKDMSPLEKDALYLLNLARTCPQKFAERYVKGYQRGGYMFAERKDSLYRQLKNMTPLDPLLPHPGLYAHCVCLVEQSVKRGYLSHSREGTTCEKRFSGECVSNAGTNDALVHICNLLVDAGKGNEALGHRRLMLSEKFHYAAAAQKNRFFVLQFWRDLSGKTDYTYDRETEQGSTQEEENKEGDDNNKEGEEEEDDENSIPPEEIDYDTYVNAQFDHPEDDPLFYDR